MKRIIVVQPEVPTYRLGFFERLSRRLGKKFYVYASSGKLGVLSQRSDMPAWERRLSPIQRIALGLEWQADALAVPLERSDVLVIWGNPRCLSNLFLLLKARFKGVKTVWWGHYRSSTSKDWSIWLRLRLMKLSDYVLFYTDQERDEYLAREGDGWRTRAFALNNGIETDEIVRLRAPYEAASRPRRLLFIGRITQKAHFNQLLTALAEPVCCDVELSVIGIGEEELALRSRAEKLQLARRIHWHGAMTDELRISDIANSCQLFVYPGSVGLSLIHGMAYGLPAIVHDERRAHMPEIAALLPGENGFTFKMNDPQSLAQVICAAMSDVKRLEVFSQIALKTVANAFNAEAMADRFCEAVFGISGTEGSGHGKR